jgi:hypothetical protein
VADVGLELDGLLEAVAASAAMRKTVDRVGADALSDDARYVVDQARRLMRGRPGGGTYRRDYQDIGTIQDRVVIRRGGTALGAEFGAVNAWVFGRETTQAALSRRQFPPRRRDGYLVGPYYRPSRKIVRRTAEVDEDLFDGAVRRPMRRAGVPR